MAYPHSLSGLSTREEIADTIIRACLGLDSNNKALWESAWAQGPEVTLDLNGNALTGLDNINKNCFDNVGPMVTQHMISGIRIDVDEAAGTARMTANAQNQHFRAGQGQVPGADHMLAGSTYDIQVVREADGKWKIKTWAMKILWTEGSWAVMQPE